MEGGEEKKTSTVCDFTCPYTSLLFMNPSYLFIQEVAARFPNMPGEFFMAHVT